MGGPLKFLTSSRRGSLNADSALCNVMSGRTGQNFLSVLSARNKAAVAATLRPASTRLLQNGKHASVLVPLHMHDGKPSILFTVRSNQLTRHRNQVSFPGGFSDEGDRDVEATALRETEEELGIPASQVDVWGALPTIPDRDRQVNVTAVIGNLGEIDPTCLCTNPAEVFSVFSLSLEHLADPAHHRHTQYKPQKFYFPVFLGGTRRVWGLTAIILDFTLRHILPAELDYQAISIAT